MNLESSVARGSSARVAAIACALTCLAIATPAPATDLWGVRASGALAFGTDRSAFATLGGATYEVFVDGFGFRAGVDVGYAGYMSGERAGQLAFGAELATFLGPDDARLRPYFVIEPLFSASTEVFEGLRVGPEIELRDICASNLRAALGIFYAPTRDAEGLSWATFGPRFTLTWGKPTLGCIEVPSCVELPGKPCPR